MARNIVLLVSTTAVLVILFVGYRQLVRAPATSEARSRSVADGLPDETATASDETVQVGPVEIPGGKRPELTRYDKHGRPTGRFRCETWKPVPDSKNEVFVEQPELTMLLPSGMVAVVSADEGQITADRIEKTGIQPQMGWLRGDARILPCMQQRLSAECEHATGAEVVTQRPAPRRKNGAAEGGVP